MKDRSNTAKGNSYRDKITGILDEYNILYKITKNSGAVHGNSDIYINDPKLPRIGLELKWKEIPRHNKVLEKVMKEARQCARDFGLLISIAKDSDGKEYDMVTMNLDSLLLILSKLKK